MSFPTQGRARSFSNASNQSREKEIVQEKVIVLPSSTNQVCTFEIRDEDHTLGNVLRVAAMKVPGVSMSAFNVPHPLETKLHLRVETVEGTTPQDALKNALDNVMSQCDLLLTEFEHANTLIE